MIVFTLLCLIGGYLIVNTVSLLGLMLFRHQTYFTSFDAAIQANKFIIFVNGGILLVVATLCSIIPFAFIQWCIIIIVSLAFLPSVFTVIIAIPDAFYSAHAFLAFLSLVTGTATIWVIIVNIMRCI